MKADGIADEPRRFFVLPPKKREEMKMFFFLGHISRALEENQMRRWKRDEILLFLQYNNSCVACLSYFLENAAPHGSSHQESDNLESREKDKRKSN